MSSLSVLILTRDEESNIQKCLASLLPLAAKIFVVDSGSTDRTVELAESMGATVVYHPWTGYADQFNWGLEHLEFTTDWIMKVDSDEELTEGLVNALQEFLTTPQSVSGVYVLRRIYFMGRWIRWGGVYPEFEGLSSF